MATRCVAGCASLEIVRIEGGDLLLVADESVEGAGRIGEPAVGSRLTELPVHGIPADGVVLSHHRDDGGFIAGDGGDGVTVGCRSERPRNPGRPADQEDRSADAVDERPDILHQTRGRVVLAGFGKPSTAKTWQITGEAIAQVRDHGFPCDVAVRKRPMNQDHGWPMSVYSSGDLGSIYRVRSVDSLISHDGPSCRFLR